MFIANLPVYKRLTRKRSEEFASRIAEIVKENSSVLDFGCGNMFTSIELLKIVPSLKITGLDVIKDQNLDENALKDSRLQFKLLETKAIPFPDNTFDAAVALATMHHTEDPEYYLSELKRVIKPGGSIILIEEMYVNFVDRIWISSQDWILNKMKKGVPVPLHFRSNKHYLNEFKKQNLIIKKEDSVRSSLTLMHSYIYELTKKM